MSLNFFMIFFFFEGKRKLFLLIINWKYERVQWLLTNMMSMRGKSNFVFLLIFKFFNGVYTWNSSRNVIYSIFYIYSSLTGFRHGAAWNSSSSWPELLHPFHAMQSFGWASGAKCTTILYTELMVKIPNFTFLFHQSSVFACIYPILILFSSTSLDVPTRISKRKHWLF